MSEVPGNPFDPNAPKPGAIRDDAGLAGFMLGEAAEADMRAAERAPSGASAKEGPASPELKTHGSLEEGMSAEEREAVKESRESRETRKRLIEWANKYNLGGEAWVDNTFEFNSKGEAICTGDLNLDFLSEPDIPKGIVEVRGYLSFNKLISAKNLHLPAKLNELYLNKLKSAEGLKLPEGLIALHLTALTSPIGLILPRSLLYLHLNGLTSAKGLILHEGLKELHVDSLESFKYLNLPESLEVIYIKGLSWGLTRQLRNQYPNLEIMT